MIFALPTWALEVMLLRGDPICLLFRGAFDRIASWSVHIWSVAVHLVGA